MVYNIFMRTKKNYDDVQINVKVDHSEQVFSKYSYDNKDILNKELSEYLWDNAKLVPAHKDLQLKFFTKCRLDRTEVSSAIKSHYKREMIEAKDEIKKANLLSFVCIVLGIISLAVLLAFYKLFDNYFIVTILDITAWVFVWEAVDVYFIRRPELLQRYKRLNKLYSAKIKIVEEK